MSESDSIHFSTINISSDIVIITKKEYDSLKVLNEKLQKELDKERKTTEELLLKKSEMCERKNENKNENQLSILIKAKEEHDKAIIVSQCVYEYIKSIKEYIFGGGYDTTILCMDIFDLLEGVYDDDMTEKEIKRKNIWKGKVIARYATTRHKNGLKNLKNILHILSIERTETRYLIRSREQVENMKLIFTEYCDKNLPDVSLNSILIEDIFGRIYMSIYHILCI